ncbi:hypothetical protein [Pseudoalteromonas piscicida]|uniref:hypothetical protein n=1 Tax=Pseudoalteromonas piscicida TaxID=43662 RepID=UPI001CB72024|nr:hypothetical protein [Pseudoalteromonas piscicida]
MRHYLTSTVFAFSLLGSPLVIAQDCVTQVSDMSLFTKSKASGLFREAIDKGPVTVDIANIKTITIIFVRLSKLLKAVIPALHCRAR